MTGSNGRLNLKEINWLASFPKSGNTWIRLLYQAHVLGILDINANVRLTNSDALPHNYQAVSSVALESLSPEYFPVIRGAALLNLITERPNKPLVVKTHSAAVKINTEFLVPPSLTASSVYLVRDPRDVACSYARYMGRPVDEIIGYMENDTHQLNTHSVVTQFVTSWSLHVRSWRNKMQPLVVRYEDLLEDTEYWFIRILEMWGIEDTGAGKAVDLCRFERLQEAEAKSGFIENLGPSTFFGNGRSVWKDQLNAQQVERIETRHGDIMKECGYG